MFTRFSLFYDAIGHFSKFNVLQFGIAQFNLHRPSQMIDIVYFDAEGVLPFCVTL